MQSSTLRRDLDRDEKEHDRLKLIGSGDRLASFGPEVKQMAELISRNHARFRGNPPIGPVGAYIKLKDPRWSKAVGNALGRFASYFLVRKNADKDTCMSLWDEINPRRRSDGRSSLQFANMNSDQFDKNICPYRDHQTIMDVIEIDSQDAFTKNVILNFLIDTCSINEIHVAVSFQEATGIIRRRLESVTLSNGVVHEIRREAYSLDSEQRNVDRWQRAKRDGSEVTKPVYSKAYFSVDVSGEAERVKRKIIDTKSKLESAKAKLESLRSERSEWERRAAGATKELKKKQR